MLFVSVLTLLGQGIIFIEENWEDALVQAEKDDKYLFVEIYGDWCSACRNMEKNIFTLPVVGDIYNHAFINVRLDGDGPANDHLTKTWNITAYPTLLITDSKGAEISRLTGFTNELDLIRFGTEVVNYAEEIRTLNQKLSQQKLKTFLLNYIDILESSKNQYLEKYFQRKEFTNLSKDDLRILNGSIQMASPLMIHNLMQFYADKRNKMDNPKHLNRLDARISKLASSFHQQDSIEKYHNHRLLLAQIYPKEYPVSSEEIIHDKENDLLEFFKSKKNINGYLLLSRKIMEERYLKLTPAQINRTDGFINIEITPGNPRSLARKTTDQINDICLTFYRFKYGNDELNSALSWIQHSINIMPLARSYLIAAGLNNHLGNNKEGRALVNKAKTFQDFDEQIYLFNNLIGIYSVE